MKSFSVFVIIVLSAFVDTSVSANPIVCCTIGAEAGTSGQRDLKVSFLKTCTADASCPPKTAVRLFRDGVFVSITLQTSETSDTCWYDGVDTPSATAGTYGLEIDYTSASGASKSRTCKSSATYGAQPDGSVSDTTSPSRADAAHLPTNEKSGSCALAGGAPSLGNVPLLLLALLGCFLVARRTPRP